MTGRRYFNAAAKRVSDGWDLDVWEPFGEKVGLTRCDSLESEEDVAVAKRIVEDFVRESLKLPDEEMAVWIYKLPGASDANA